MGRLRRAPAAAPFLREQPARERAPVQLREPPVPQQRVEQRLVRECLERRHVHERLQENFGVVRGAVVHEAGVDPVGHLPIICKQKRTKMRASVCEKENRQNGAIAKAVLSLSFFLRAL